MTTDDPCDEWPIWAVPGVLADFVAHAIGQILPGNVFPKGMIGTVHIGGPISAPPATVTGRIISPGVMIIDSVGPEAITPHNRTKR